MPSQHWEVRWIECLPLTAGVAHLLVYFSARIHRAAMYRAGLWTHPWVSVRVT